MNMFPIIIAISRTGIELGENLVILIFKNGKLKAEAITRHSRTY